MRLGVIMRGAGACAAANVGVLEAFFSRGLDVYAVCGVNGGSWFAAQYVSGMDMTSMKESLSFLKRINGGMLRAHCPARLLFQGRRAWLCEGNRINRLLKLQTGEKLLALCSRRGIFPLRVASTGRRIVFSTCAYAQGREAMLCQQATVSFAARAALARPPLLAPLPWGGSWLLADEDAVWAVQQLLQLGADRVLIIDPRPALSRNLDALELASAPGDFSLHEAESSVTGLLTIRMPPRIGALDFKETPEIARIGYEAAQAQLDAALEKLGMAQCRILPFKAREQQAAILR